MVRNNSTTERECLGVVCSVLELLHFLDGHGFPMRWRLRPLEYTVEMQ